jgi:hypothetical protein
MAVSLKCADIIKQYDGEGDFSEWISKLELVCKLQKISELENFLPLFLSGGAFAVYESLEETVKSDYSLLKEALISAFTVSQISAYKLFKTRSLRVGEAVDVYLSDLKRLASLVGRASLINEEWIKCAFIDGLPENVRVQLVAACSLEKMSIQDVLERSRSLVHCEEVVISAVSKQRPNQLAYPTQPNTVVSVPQRVVKCFACQKDGHISRNCPDKLRNEDRGGHFSHVKSMKCYNCEEIGHFASTCPKRNSKNF